MTKKGCSRRKGNLKPSDYTDLLQTIKKRIQESRITAYRAVNREIIVFCWNIGRKIALRQEQEGWGKSVVERLSHNLRKEFPVFEFSQMVIYILCFHTTV